MNLPKLIVRVGAAAALAAATQLCGAGPTLAAPAEAPATEVPAEAAAGWLAGQLTGDDKDHFVFAGGDFADIGLTIDAVLAFDAAKVAGKAASAATAFVQRNAGSYVGFGDERYPGSYAKLLLLAEAHGTSPAAFGGLNLPVDLAALECGATRTECATTPGRYANETGATTYDATKDFSSPLTQALAVLALKRTPGADPSEAAITYLLSERCTDGGYPSSFAASRGGSACGSDPDVTAFVIQALYAVGRGADAQASVTWLAARQRSDGSFGGTGPTDKPNANSTAVAAQALRVAGQDAAAKDAVGYLLSLQSGCDAEPADRGQVRYDAAASGDPVRATAQAVLALTGTSIVDVSASGASMEAPILACAVDDDVEQTTEARASDLTRGGTILADTGADVGIAAAGICLIGLGTLLLLAARPRPHKR